MGVEPESVISWPYCELWQLRCMVACLILTMNPEQLAHLDRIGALVDALGSLPWMETPELE